MIRPIYQQLGRYLPTTAIGRRSLFLCFRCCNENGTHKKPPIGTNKKKDASQIDFEKLERELDESVESTKPDERELSKEFMNFRRLQEASVHQRSGIFTWGTVSVAFVFGGVALCVLLYMKKLKNEEQEKRKKRMLGKANIGGEWELVNMDGNLESSKDLLGNWLLIYFGFTNCPDICPEEIEKMVDVVDTLDQDEDSLPIIPVFISVDPQRDTPERVKKYCVEFSPKLRGYTGSNEQIEKVTKAYRVYRSEGPKTHEDDYIVDHTVIMYLVDPEGNFHDYYGQNRRTSEIVNIIRTKQLKYGFKKKSAGSWFNFNTGGSAS